jgi:hypothetical protein
MGIDVEAVVLPGGAEAEGAGAEADDVIAASSEEPLFMCCGAA